MIKNFGDMMKQAASLQSKMQEMQESVAAIEVEGQSGGGMVKVTLNGKGFASRIAIEPSVISENDKDVLEDLICAAINDAKSKVDVLSQEEMKKLTQGLPLPDGLKLPF